ncbi:MAG: hypothetical protein M3Y41_02595 [Pseudomonadota bacterium]|nr:hypothetical protein [Pseudomonadota bacterium]
MTELSSLDLASRDDFADGRRESRALQIRLGGPEVSRLQASFVQLYHAIEVRRTGAMPLVVQFISPANGAGATTVASGYARVAALQSSQPVLFLDCSGERLTGARSQEPVTLMDTYRRGLPLSAAIVPVRDASNLLWARLCPAPHALMALGGDGLNRLLGLLRAQYPLIVLDSPPADAPEAAALSRYCDGSVLVVAAGRTRESEIMAARNLIERLGGQTVGIVLNRQRALLPRWLDRRL